MMLSTPRLFPVVAIAFTFVMLGLPSSAHATLQFFYNPETGNVSFDTSETRTGWSYSYGLSIRSDRTDIRFIPENMVRLSNSSQFFQLDIALSDNSLSSPFTGLLTIGDVLPAGLSEARWLSLFPGRNEILPGAAGAHTYADLIGGGEPPAAEFIYGAPEGEFDNRWDLVDPDTLQWAQTAKLIYRAWSGEVLLDTTGPDSGHISSVWLRSESDVFIPENYEPIPQTTTPPPFPKEISILANAIEPDLYSLGNILEPGLTPAEFNNTFSIARFMERAGFQGGSFDFESQGLDFQLTYAPVPEPASLAFFATASLWLGSRRRSPA